VNDPEEIKNFYKNELLFSIKHKFTIDSDISNEIFNVAETTDVYIMNCNDVTFEIFTTHEKEHKVFSHICLGYRQAENVNKYVLKGGYESIIKKGGNNITCFIWNKNNNMFEIKDLKS